MRRYLHVMLLGAAVVGFSAPRAAAADKSVEAIFKNRDLNGDGMLSFEEYVGKASVDLEKVRARFNKLDKDGNGFLSFPEFAAAPRFKK